MATRTDRERTAQRLGQASVREGTITEAGAPRVSDSGASARMFPGYFSWGYYWVSNRKISPTYGPDRLSRKLCRSNFHTPSAVVLCLRPMPRLSSIPRQLHPSPPGPRMRAAVPGITGYGSTGRFVLYSISYVGNSSCFRALVPVFVPP